MAFLVLVPLLTYLYEIAGHFRIRVDAEIVEHHTLVRKSAESPKGQTGNAPFYC